ncbi:MAG: hypothetical protein ACLPN5_13030 [Roseiarcus sp.]
MAEIRERMASIRISRVIPGGSFEARNPLGDRFRRQLPGALARALTCDSNPEPIVRVCQETLPERLLQAFAGLDRRAIFRRALRKLAARL